MAEGAGSVWNAGSWHWESKNFTQAMKGMVADGVAALSEEKDGVTVRVTSVKEVTGDAEINIRKGKKLTVFEVALKAEYEATKAGEDASAEKGSFRVFEVYQDDVHEDFEVRFSVTSPGKGFSAREVCRGPLAESVRGVIRNFAAKLPEMDGGEAALAEAKRVRAAERAVADAAAAVAAAQEAEAERVRLREAEAIAATVAHRESLARAKAAEAEAGAPAAGSDGDAAEAGASASASAGPEAGAGAAVADGASVWNRGGYHWEERDLTSWAKGRLTELLEEVELDVPGGVLRVAEVKELKGDASSSVRKGAKRVFFEFRAKLAWEGEIIAADGSVKASGDGEAEIGEFDQDDDPESVTITVKAASSKRSDEGLGRQMKMQGEAPIREALRTFVAELRER